MVSGAKRCFAYFLIVGNSVSHHIFSIIQPKQNSYMKNLFLIIAFVFCTTLAAAQDHDSHGNKDHKKHDKEHKKDKAPTERAENFTKKLQKKANLSTAQVDMVKAAALEHFTQIAALPKEKSDVKKAQRDALHLAFDAKLKTILSAEQYAIYEKEKDHHHEDGENHKEHDKKKK